MSNVLTLFPDDDRFQPSYTSRVYWGLTTTAPLLVKIGLTSRASGHRGGELHFTEMCSVEGDRLIEARYHRKYAAERIGRTEWFWPSDQLLLDMFTMCVGQHRAPAAEILKKIIWDRLRERKAA